MTKEGPNAEGRMTKTTQGAAAFGHSSFAHLEFVPSVIRHSVVPSSPWDRWRSQGPSGWADRSRGGLGAAEGFFGAALGHQQQGAEAEQVQAELDAPAAPPARDLVVDPHPRVPQQQG